MASLSVKDCCRVLGVDEDASIAEIKRAFREKAKRLHPDVSAHGKKRKDKKEQRGLPLETSSEMLELLEAYRTLSDPAIREQANAAYPPFRARGASNGGGFDYRLWLRSRKDPQSRAKLIFFDLLHGFEEEAVSAYLALKRGEAGFSLFDWLEREDFMDCGFILAEELDLRGELCETFALLAGIAACEYQKPYFRHFFPEALDFLRNVLRKMGQEAAQGCFHDSLALKCFERALELGLGAKDDAFILARMAECCERLGDERGAAACRNEAEKIIPQKQGGQRSATKAKVRQSCDSA